MLSRGLARLAVRRPGVLVAAGILLLAAAGWVFQSQRAFDSEILNLLPADATSVQGLKIFNSRFNSARELAFLIETDDAAAADDFVEELSRQPWVLRALDAPPTVSAAGRATLPELAAPLIVSQAAEEFDASLARLEPERLKARIASLVAKAASGSPVARLELENDPTGLIAPVAAELSKRLAISETFNMSSPTARIVPVITNQADLGADSCAGLMRSVRSFLDAMSKRPGAPAVSVTGRAAYVDEIAGSMQRDIALTSAVSIAFVTFLFWFSFRSLLPLAGSVLILGWSCLIALAAGSVVFDQLNVVAMGFCSILVGLGDDFSLLLYQRYIGARASGLDRENAIADSLRHSAPGILWVALTTGLGFAALSLSGSAGFAQLGILIAIGVVTGAFGMLLFMPLFEREPRTASGDPVLRFCFRMARDARISLFAWVIFPVAVLIALLPWRPLSFDTSTHSLEPRDIPAARTLARIMELFPATFEPVMAVIPGPSDRHALEGLDSALQDLKARGLIERYSSPTALVADRAQVAANLARLRAQDLDGAERVIQQTAESAGLKPGALDPAMRLIRGLESEEPLQGRLPSASPWWFVLDRMLSPGTGDVIYYIQLPAGSGRPERRAVEKAVLEAVPEALVTGWSQMLNDLVPWATRELEVFGGIVVAVIVAVLMFLYRERKALLLHLATLFLAMCGTVATLKITGHPVNLLNVLAFPLILAVGVDYGIHLLLVGREQGSPRDNLPAVMKPVLISALTTITGFGALTIARNPALSGLGFVCATGVAWCLLSSFLVIVPVMARPHRAVASGGGSDS